MAHIVMAAGLDELGDGRLYKVLAQGGGVIVVWAACNSGVGCL